MLGRSFYVEKKIDRKNRHTWKTNMDECIWILTLVSAGTVKLQAVNMTIHSE